jgi:hypothetical protein
MDCYPDPARRPSGGCDLGEVRTAEQFYLEAMLVSREEVWNAAVGVGFPAI